MRVPEGFRVFLLSRLGFQQSVSQNSFLLNLINQTFGIIYRPSESNSSPPPFHYSLFIDCPGLKPTDSNIAAQVPVLNTRC